MTKEDILSDYLRPSHRLVNDIARIEGDILILGAGGKMGPAMAKLAQDAINKAGIKKKVIAVSRFRDSSIPDQLNSYGIETINADLLNDRDLGKIPEIPNIIYLVGHKFGTRGNESYT